MNQQGLTKKQEVEPSCQLTHCHLLNVILYSKIYVHRQCWFRKFDNQVKFYSSSFNKRGNVDRKMARTTEAKRKMVITCHNCNYSTVHSYTHMTTESSRAVACY